MCKAWWLSLFCCVWLLATASVHADLILIGNLPSNDIGSTMQFNQTAAYSIGFTIGNQPVTINSVNLRLRSQGAAGSVSLQLRTNDGNIPPNPSNTGVLNFANQTVAESSAFSQYTFTPSGMFTLLNNTTYWLTLGTDHSGSTGGVANGLVMVSNNPSKTPAGSYATIVGLRTGFPNDQTIDATGDYPSFQVNGDVVSTPEPSTGLLVLASLVFLAGFTCWRRFQRSTWRLMRHASGASIRCAPVIPRQG